MLDTITIIGAGNGGKAAAADLAGQGRCVRLFEFPEYKVNIRAIAATKTLLATGVVQGEIKLDAVTCDLAEAVAGADMIMVCTQALPHERVAHELAPLITRGMIVVLNPGSTGGALLFAKIFAECSLPFLPTLVEFSTLTYACRGSGNNVNIYLKADRVMYAALPAQALDAVAADLETMYPGLVRGGSVLEAALNCANPVIHPPITLMNAGRIENEGSAMGFYRDGVSPAVARIIEQLDEERMALLQALGYAAQSDPVTSVEQGYAESTDYYECYCHGPIYRQIASPDSLDNRFIHEDIGMGLVMFCSLGKLLGLPMPASETMVALGSLVADRDFMAAGGRTLEALGIEGLDVGELKQFLRTGCR